MSRSVVTADADELRTLGVYLTMLETRADCIAVTPMPQPPHPLYADLKRAATNAMRAHPDCPACWGFGVYDLFRAGGDPDDPDRDPEERDCPVCRPWANGFTGLAHPLRRRDDTTTVWRIPPYRAGEHAAHFRGVPIPWPIWDDQGGPKPWPFNDADSEQF